VKVAIICMALAACGGKHAGEDDPPAPPPRDAARAPADAAGWAELAPYTQVQPVHVLALPVKKDAPRLDVGGPALAGDVAVVASSRFGFVAVDYHRGQIAWTKPGGPRVAPPLVIGGNVLLIADCAMKPAPGEVVLGCLRAVTPTGSDLGYVAIHGHARELEAFSLEPAAQRVWSSGARTITWRRGERAVTVDTLTGAATPIAASDPPLIVHYKDRTWEIGQTADGRIAGREHARETWRTQRPYTAVLGAVYLPEQAPMVRVSNAAHYGGHPEMMLLDIDATGSLHGQVAFPVPGIGLLGSAIDAVGDAALAIRLDASLERDFIVGYAANALLMWVYPLPREPRVDPIGLAVAPDAVLVFDRGETFTVLPELSAPPTAPGAARPPSENPTP
jgi:hypothetical protein